MFQNNPFDNEKGASKEFAPHPEGEYEGFIEKTEVKTSPTQGEYISLWIKTSEGRLFHSMFLHAPKEVVKKIAYETLEKILWAAYTPDVLQANQEKMKEMVQDTNAVARALVDLPVQVYVKHKEWDGKKRANVYFNDLPSGKLDEFKSDNKPAMSY